MSAYIGCQISLISTSDVRYEGTLYSIDATESTIALKNVKHMGTEDRRTDKVIEASPTVYQYIIFSGENIKNIKLIDQETENALLNDPAILDVKQGPEFFKPTPAKSPEEQHWNNQGGGIRSENWNDNRGGGSWQSWNSGANYFRGGYRTRARGGHRGGYNFGNYNNNYRYPQNDWTYRPQRGRGRTATRNVRRRGGRRERSSRGKNGQNYIPGTGKFLEQHAKDNDDSNLVIPEKEFDFEGNLARFEMSSLKNALPEETQTNTEAEPNEPKFETNDDKIETKEEISEQDLLDENSKEQTKEEVESKYDKDNFFDTLSTDKDVFNSQTGKNMRELNAETFGKIGSTYRCRTRWFRQRRGRGSRGSFRGGYNQRQ